MAIDPARVPNGNGKGHARTLDLDALYGASDPLTIMWRGHEYPILRMMALGAREIIGVMRLRTRVVDLMGDDPAEVAPEQVEIIEKVLSDLFALIAPTLPITEMPFALRVATAGWYFNEADAGEGTGEKKQTPRRPTTATRSRRSRSGTRSALKI